MYIVAELKKSGETEKYKDGEFVDNWRYLSSWWCLKARSCGVRSILPKNMHLGQSRVRVRLGI